MGTIPRHHLVRVVTGKSGASNTPTAQVAAMLMAARTKKMDRAKLIEAKRTARVKLGTAPIMST